MPSETSPENPKAVPTQDVVESQLTEELAGTRFACRSLTALSGGTANFIFRGTLQTPLEDGTNEVVVKHGEAYGASTGTLSLPTTRCVLEKECLRLAQDLTPAANPSYSVRVPRLLSFNPATNTQILEYLPGSLNLKEYALKNFSPSAHTPAVKPCVVEIGRGLGKWLRGFHEWAASPEQQERLRTLALMNTGMQTIKLHYSYKLLLVRAEAHPEVLEEARPIFETVLADVEEECVDRSRLQPIHGDFWTGNILLPDAPIEPDRQVPLFVIDWEMCQLWKPQLDLGQMIAELYELYLYKNIDAGLWLIEGFLAGYGFVDDDFAFRTVLHVGTHLVGFGTIVPGWGDTEQTRTVLQIGKDIIVSASKKDREWFEAHDLAPLFRANWA